MNGKKAKKQGAWERIRSFFSKTEIEQPLLYGYRVELIGQGNCARALVSGVLRISVCHSEQVVLQVKGKTLSFCGQGLACLCYEGRVAEIRGNIRSFSFLEETV